MKMLKILIMTIVAIVLLSICSIMLCGDSARAAPQRSLPCYVCKDGNLIKYKGKDSFLLRQEVWEKYKCLVIGRIWECDTKTQVKEKKYKQYTKNYWKK
jgi:hypothetical protein